MPHKGMATKDLAGLSRPVGDGIAVGVAELALGAFSGIPLLPVRWGNLTELILVRGDVHVRLIVEPGVINSCAKVLEPCCNSELI